VATPRRPRPVADPLDAAARAWLGEPPPAVLQAVGEKQRLLAQVPDSWPGDPERWAAVKARLEPSLAGFGAVADALRRAGIPGGEPGYLGIDAPMLRAGLRYGGRLRSRYTVVDFLEGQGMLEEALDRALEC
jgi:glycerol-1-phosphate dehydrogenase [NAD(P)+]